VDPQAQPVQPVREAAVVVLVLEALLRLYPPPVSPTVESARAEPPLEQVPRALNSNSLRSAHSASELLVHPEPIIWSVLDAIDPVRLGLRLFAYALQSWNDMRLNAVVAEYPTVLLHSRCNCRCIRTLLTPPLL